MLSSRSHPMWAKAASAKPATRSSSTSTTLFRPHHVAQPSPSSSPRRSASSSSSRSSGMLQREMARSRSPHEAGVLRNLILEVLNAQPSLRDSKQYIKSFGPKGSNANAVAGPSRIARPPPPSSLQQQQQQTHLPGGLPFHPPPPPTSPLVTPLPPQPDAAITTPRDAAHTDGTQAYLESSATADVSIQQHTALVKVQGPFTRRQLESIADGMVYLKKLGLVSVIVVEGDGWSQPGFAAEFDEHGIALAGADEQEAQELAPWTGDAAFKVKRAQARDLERKRHVALRRAMLSDVQSLADMLQERGAPSRPFLGPLLRVDASSSSTGQRRRRSPLVSDDDLESLRAALTTDHIPIIAPLALYSDPNEGGAERSVPVKADDVLVALARDMAARAEYDAMEGSVDLMPVRLMVINREGGIPSHARGGNPHLAINLASEYSHIKKSFIWTYSHPTALSNLDMVHDCLSYMPHTSSGIVVSHRSPRSLIANLITNKAAHSPSLPYSLLKSRQDVRHTPTIIRPGLPVKVLEDLKDVDKEKLTQLLEASFRRKLDAAAYYKRLEAKLDFVIVTGDYQGAAIVTKETLPGDGPDDEPIAYLDKFAVLPQLQGSGTVDFLWGALRDEVQGLGLLDALNDNGGKGGFGRGRDLVWKSRADNPVNRWYYERSNGFVKVDTTPSELRASKTPEELERGRSWVLFWCDAEERLSKMSGERRLGASASAEDVLNSIDDAEAAVGFEEMDGDEHDGGLSMMRHASSGTGRRATARRRGWESAAEDDYDDGHHPPGSARSHRARRPSSPFERRISQLDPRPGGAGQKLLPVIAPDEAGRLERWARCMCYIPSAWAA